MISRLFGPKAMWVGVFKRMSLFPGAYSITFNPKPDLSGEVFCGLPHDEQLIQKKQKIVKKAFNFISGKLLPLKALLPRMFSSEIPSHRLLGCASRRSNLDPVYFQRIFTVGNEHS